VPGGIDYVAIVEGPPVVPVIGEVKAGNDGDAFYAFVQLLTYLAWMCPEAQLARATTHLFRQSLPSPTRWDLHLLLCDRNKRSAKERLVGPTEELAQRFSQEVRFRMAEQTPLGRILCLRMGEMSTNEPSNSSGVRRLIATSGSNRCRSSPESNGLHPTGNEA